MSDNSEENKLDPEDTHFEKIPLPKHLEKNIVDDEDVPVWTAFIGDDKSSFEEDSYKIFSKIFNNLNGDSKEVNLKDLGASEKSSKSFDGSNQIKTDISEPSAISFAGSKLKVQSPPYDPYCFAEFLNVSEVHAKCVNRKVKDSVCVNYRIKSKLPIKVNDEDGGNIHQQSITQQQFNADCEKIENFIRNCNKTQKFSQICYKVCLLYTSPSPRD